VIVPIRFYDELFIILSSPILVLKIDTMCKTSSFFNIFSLTTSTRNIKLSIIVLETLLLKLLLIIAKVIHNKNWNFCVFLFFILLVDSIQNFRGLKYLDDGFRLRLKKRDLKKPVNLLCFLLNAGVLFLLFQELDVDIYFLLIFLAAYLKKMTFF
jgi:hypothetical protein